MSVTLCELAVIAMFLTFGTEGVILTVGRELGTDVGKLCLVGMCVDIGGLIVGILVGF